jgi:signal transduction histidine kinase
MVYGTIRKHEGYIDVISEINKGSRFDIYLPIAKAKSPSELL